MITTELISYVAGERAKGVSDTDIATVLRANGWAESDVVDVFLPPDSPVRQSHVLDVAGLKAFRKKMRWITFVSLLVVDVIIIFWFKLTYNHYGLYGIDPASIFVRIIIIFGIAHMASRSALPGDNMARTVISSIVRVLGSIIITILVLGIIAFATCLIAVKFFGLD